MGELESMFTAVGTGLIIACLATIAIVLIVGHYERRDAKR